MQLYPVKDDLCDKADDREACDHTGDQGAAVVEGDHGCDHRPAHHLHSEPHSRVLRHINVPALQCTAHAAANQPNTSHYKRLQKTVVLKSNVEKCSSVELRAEFHKSVGSAARGGFPAPASPEDCNTMKYNEIQCNQQKKCNPHCTGMQAVNHPPAVNRSFLAAMISFCLLKCGLDCSTF